jgi:hypothetical protein
MTVSTSLHIQGVVRVIEMPSQTENGTSLANDKVEGSKALPFDQWSGTFGVEWLRTAEVPYEVVDAALRSTMITDNDATMAPPLTMSSMPDGHELLAAAGHMLMQKLFLHPVIRLHLKSVEDEWKCPGGAHELATRRRMAAEIVAGFNDPVGL